MDRRRRLVCAGKLFRQSDSAFERRGRFGLFVLLFDNYRQRALPSSNPPFWPLTAILDSCDDEARGEGAGHEVTGLQTGKNAGRPSLRVYPANLTQIGCM